MSASHERFNCEAKPGHNCGCPRCLVHYLRFLRDLDQFEQRLQAHEQRHKELVRQCAAAYLEMSKPASTSPLAPSKPEPKSILIELCEDAPIDSTASTPSRYTGPPIGLERANVVRRTDSALASDPAALAEPPQYEPPKFVPPKFMTFSQWCEVHDVREDYGAYFTLWWLEMD